MLVGKERWDIRLPTRQAGRFQQNRFPHSLLRLAQAEHPSWMDGGAGVGVDAVVCPSLNRRATA
jgi:hypothetical protein